MSDSNHQMPPQIPELPDLPEIPEDAKQDHSFSSLETKPQNPRKKTSTKKKGFKPGQWLLCSWLAILVSFVGMMFLPSSSSGAEYISSDHDKGLPSCVRAEPFQVSKPTDNTVMINFHLTKDDPAIYASLFIDVEITANEDYGELYNFSHIELGYGQEDAWTSVLYTSFQLEGVDAKDIQVDVDYESSYTTSLMDYDYYLDEGEDATYENILWHYLKRHPEQNPRIEVISDGVDQQNGVVQYQVSLDSDGVFYGNANILFKNKGEVVFAEMVDLDASTNQHTFAYSAPIPLPEYDAVEIQYILE